MNSQKTNTLFATCIKLSCIAVFMCFAGNSASVLAEPASSELKIKHVGTIETDHVFSEEFFNNSVDPNLSGVGFPPGASTTLDLKPEGGATLTLVVPPKNPSINQVFKTPIDIPDSINMTFDSTNRAAAGYGLARLLYLKGNQLTAVKADAQDVMNPATLKHTDMQSFGITAPQGMTMNPANGQVFILDRQRIVRLMPKHGREFNAAEVSTVNLPQGLGEYRGIAFSPANGHLYVLSAGEKKLHELTLEGVLVRSLDFSGLPSGIAQGMVFARSVDETDPPSTYTLFLVMANGSEAELTEWALSGKP